MNRIPGFVVAVVYVLVAFPLLWTTSVIVALPIMALTLLLMSGIPIIGNLFNENRQRLDDFEKRVQELWDATVYLYTLIQPPPDDLQGVRTDAKK